MFGIGLQLDVFISLVVIINYYLINKIITNDYNKYLIVLKCFMKNFLMKL